LTWTSFGTRIPDSKSSSLSPLRLLWLGRIIPRKRLDLLLDGADIAIRQGLDLRVTIVGRVGFVPGYERLIDKWPHRDRLQWIQTVARTEVPELMHRHDLLVQPSEEEDFGSSVAEAQSCGMPVIVGRTNGNADYLCARDIRLPDYSPESLASALREMASRRQTKQWGDPMISRRVAERHFSINSVTDRLIEILEGVIRVHGAPAKN
jgi:glycosyltransferase involved in cell wall biosynthesis